MLTATKKQADNLQRASHCREFHADCMKHFPKEVLKWKARRAVNPYPADTFLDTSADFKKPYTDGIGLSILKHSSHECRLESLYEEKGTGMKKQPELIGQEGSAGGSVCLEMILELFDTVFHVPPLAIEAVDISRRGLSYIGDDKADIFAFLQVFSLHNDPALLVP